MVIGIGGALVEKVHPERHIIGEGDVAARGVAGRPSRSTRRAGNGWSAAAPKAAPKKPSSAAKRRLQRREKTSRVRATAADPRCPLRRAPKGPAAGRTEAPRRRASAATAA